MLKKAEDFAANSVINSGSDAQIVAMMGNLQTMEPNARNASGVRKAVSNAETKKVQIENSEGYVNAVRQKQGK